MDIFYLCMIGTIFHNKIRKIRYICQYLFTAYWCYEPRIYYEGDNIDQYTWSHLRQCQGECEGNTDCVAFSWYGNDSRRHCTQFSQVSKSLPSVDSTTKKEGLRETISARKREECLTPSPDEMMKSKYVYLLNNIFSFHFYVTRAE